MHAMIIRHVLRWLFLLAKQKASTRPPHATTHKSLCKWSVGICAQACVPTRGPWLARSKTRNHSLSCTQDILLSVLAMAADMHDGIRVDNVGGHKPHLCVADPPNRMGKTHQSMCLNPELQGKQWLQHP